MTRNVRVFSRALLSLLPVVLWSFSTPAMGQQRPSTIQIKNNRAEAVVEFQRPLKGTERPELIRSGVRIYRALGGNRYLVRVNREGLAVLERHPLLVRISEVDVNSKISATIRAGKPAPHAVTPEGTVRVVVRFYPDVEFGQAVSTLRRNGLTPAAGKTDFLFGNRLEASGTAEQIAALASSLYVEHIQEVSPPAALENVQAAQLSNVDDIQVAPYNLTGNGARVGVWDGSPVRIHNDFGVRVTQIEDEDDAFASRDHGTHVIGTIAGSGAGNANARGMATQVTVFAYGFGGDVPGEQNNAFTNEQIRASNNSFGPNIGWTFSGGMWSDVGNDNLFGAYEGEAVAWDQLVRNRTALTVMTSAGNHDGDCDPSDSTDCDGVLVDGQRYDLVATFKNAKNIITVAALNDDGTTKTGFSSTGPSDDGRIKPDISTNGFNLTSTCITQGPPEADGYCVKQGTSMAAPVVTGTVALLTQHYRQRYGVTAAPSADIFKALLTNSADDIGRPGPDYRFGFGRMNALRAAETVDAGPVRILTGTVDGGDTDEYLLPVQGGLPELKVTLNWIDPPGGASTADDNNDPDIVNDLDLELVAPNNAILYPFSGPGRGNETANATATGPNTRDTVEQAVVANPQQGFWKVRVKGTSVPDGPQNYALVSNVSFSLPDQPEIEVNAPLAFNELCVGGQEDRTVSIFNTGGGVLQVSAIMVQGSPAFSILSGPSAPFQILSGAHVDLTIRFAPTEQATDYAGTLTIISNDADEGTIVIPMSGSTGAPEIDTVIAAGGDFGSVCSESLKDLTLTINNSGSCRLDVSNITSSCADFTVATVLSYPVTIGAGDSLSVPIRFTPTSVGPKQCTLDILSNDPDAPVVSLNLTGNTPAPQLTVASSMSFLPEVIQSIGACTTSKPAPISNNGQCSVTVNDVVISSGVDDYSLSGKPQVPIPVQSGHLFGDGDFRAVFGPTPLDRDVPGVLSVTWVTDPFQNTTTVSNMNLCGEGVHTGARVLVRAGGAPLATVEKIQLQRVGANRNKNKLDTVDTAQNLPLQSVIPAEPCTPFQFHREYGTVGNPVQLLPGSYQVTATAIVNGKRRNLTVGFDVDTCDFNPQVIVDF